MVKYWIVLLLLSICEFTLAVPAPRIIHELQQASGIKFNAYLIGDEHWYCWETTEGYTILYDETTQNWYYATTSKEGTLIKSNILAHESPPKTLKKHIRPDKLFRQKDSYKRPLKKFTVPTVGTINIPVLLIDFPRERHTFTTSAFQSLLFDPNKPSMTDYYLKVSYGKLKVAGEVIGWLRASKDHAYYGRDSPEEIDVNVFELVKEAISQADAQVDFRKYAVDVGDEKVIPVVKIVHQGQGQEYPPHNPNDIWSHMANLELANIYIYADGCRILSYTIQPELLTKRILITVGVFCHELGHVLGLPDLYDRTYRSWGLGMWSLMAAGSWGRDKLWGDSPTLLDAWCKKELGWVNVKYFAEEDFAQEGFLVENSQKNNTIYKILPKGYSQGYPEYFLVENRIKVDLDKALPGSGILIYHIDETRRDWWEWNNWPGPYLVALEQADGQFDLEKNLLEGEGNEGDEYDPWYVGNPHAPNLGDVVVFPDDTEEVVELPDGKKMKLDSRLNDGTYSGISIMITSPATETMRCITTRAIILPPVQSVVVAYPNPWIKDKHKDKKITFKVKDEHLKKVKIYDISGALVKEIPQAESDDQIEFCPKELAAGLYIVVAITSEGRISSTKFCVVR